MKDIRLFLFQTGEEVQPHNPDFHCNVQSHPSVEMVQVKFVVITFIVYTGPRIFNFSPQCLSGRSDKHFIFLITGKFSNKVPQQCWKSVESN